MSKRPIAVAAAALAVVLLLGFLMRDGATEHPPALSKFVDCEVICPEMIVIPAGSFSMGTAEKYDVVYDWEMPARTIRFERPFAISATLVTRAQWDACVAEGGCRALREDQKVVYEPEPHRTLELPVNNISWHDAKSYVAWLSRRTGLEYRLPSEAEWEYAARAGTTTRYWWGDAFQKGFAVCRECGTAVDNKSPMPVRSFVPNPWGLFDVTGNLNEWVEDCFNSEGYRPEDPTDGSPVLSGDCHRRVVRGGSYTSQARYLRSASRGFYDPAREGFNTGLRVVREF